MLGYLRYAALQDLGKYGWRVMLFNLRFNAAISIARLLIRKPVYLAWSDEGVDFTA